MRLLLFFSTPMQLAKSLEEAATGGKEEERKTASSCKGKAVERPNMMVVVGRVNCCPHFIKYENGT